MLNSVDHRKGSQHVSVARRSHDVRLLTTCGLVASSLIWLIVAGRSQWPGAYLLVSLLVLVAAIPVVRAHVAGRLDVFEPITGICAMYVMYFGFAAVYELNTPFKEGRLGLEIEDGIQIGLVYAIAALLALQLGYALAGSYASGAPAASVVPVMGWCRVFWTSVLVYGIGLSARVYGVSRGFHIRFAASEVYGQYSGLDILYDYMGFLSTYGFILMVAFSFVTPRWRAAGRGLAWGVMLPIEMFFAFLGGPKEYFIPLLVAPVICYHYGRRAVSVAKVVIPASVMALIVFPVMTSYRSLDPGYLRRTTLMDGVGYAISGVWGVLSEKGLPEYVRWSLELVASRLDGIYTLAGVLLNVPGSMGYQWGKTIVLGFALLVPTFIWEGKYDYLSKTITWGEGIFGVPVGGGGISITHPGELFLNFGTAGVLLGMFLLGAAFRLIYEWLVGRRLFFGIVIYAVLWPTLVVPEYPIAAYFSNAAKQAGLLFLISLAAGARWRRDRTKA